MKHVLCGPPIAVAGPMGLQSKRNGCIASVQIVCVHIHPLPGWVHGADIPPDTWDIGGAISLPINGTSTDTR